MPRTSRDAGTIPAFSNDEDAVLPLAPEVKQPRKRIVSAKSLGEAGLAVNPNSKELDRLAQKFHGWRGDKAMEVQLQKRVISTGCWALDFAHARIDPVVGNGGWAQRQFVETCGETSVGKSNLTECFLYQLEKLGLFGVVVATEEPAYPRMIRTGVTPGNHLFLPTYEAVDDLEKTQMAEERLAQACEVSSSKNCGAIIIQTVKGLVGFNQVFKGGKQSKGKKPFNETEMATRAVLLEKFFNRIKKYNNSAVVIFENHLYKQIGIDYTKDKEARKSTPGGNRLHCESYVRVAIKSARLRHGDHHLISGYKPQYGLHQFFEVFKNRWSPKSGSRNCDAKFYFDRNPHMVHAAEFDNEIAVLTHGVDLGLIEAAKGKNNAVWYKIEGEKAIKGQEAMLAHLISDYDLSYSLYLKLMARHEEIYAHHGGNEVRKTRAGLVRQGVKIEDVEFDEDEEEDED